MNHVAIYQRPDGGLSLSPIARDREENETPEEFADAAYRRIEAAIPGGVRLGLHPVTDVEAMYADHGDFRDAWRWSGGLAVYLPAAREVAADRLRIAREPLLAALDVAYLRAVEQGADTAEIVAEKQRLRDLPAVAAAAVSLDELRAIVP